MAQHGHILRGVVGANPAPIFIEGNIEHPMHTIFNPPMLPNEGIRPGGIDDGCPGPDDARIARAGRRGRPSPPSPPALRYCTHE